MNRLKIITQKEYEDIYSAQENNTLIFFHSKDRLKKGILHNISPVKCSKSCATLKKTVLLLQKCISELFN